MPRAAFQFPTLQSDDPDSFGGFQLVARLGEGGMGQVFLALSPGGQPTALKVIRHEFAGDAEFGQRFAREVGAAQKVRGAHLAPLLDADPQAERPWLATTYVAGPSLRDLVADHGPLPTEQVMLLAWGIAHALADIHAANVVHRDLKPGNIMLDESGPKVIDFGIVKSLTQSVTYRSHSTRIGTPLYMSPEQASGRAVGAASDVFALGSTLYFLAAGREAFAAENEWAVAHRVVADDPDVSLFTPPLRQLIAACLHKDPGQRPTPLRVREWCEEELGNALGPGAWMGITGARAAIQARTSALRALAVAGSEAADTAFRNQPDSPHMTGGDEGGGTTEAVPVASSAPAALRGTQKLPQQVPNPIGPPSVGEVIGPHVAEILVAAGALVWASFKPLFSETWKKESSGTQVAHVVERFNWQHPWEAIPSGIPGLATSWQAIPIGVIGTAAGLALALLFLLRLAGSQDLKKFGLAAGVICAGWITIVTLLGLWVLAMTFGLEPSDDANPGYTIRTVLLPGGWLLLLANGLMADALRRTHGYLARWTAGST
ncbi:serine/threonine-protein kinase [Streptomyces sp. NBC_00572]|uniref:serine/threonine-protein kinase n=1 Tax=Streptomyces sp. NBC_00572 TaxID=2903664 RepID=UPI002259170A|nr:serine/threonine-protein kinase [Streptomyces sp. NBC_00572]MCX4987097.1 serine/threonine protein kinase [Streptomyces sp. NBC_00572]